MFTYFRRWVEFHIKNRMASGKSLPSLWNTLKKQSNESGNFKIRSPSKDWENPSTQGQGWKLAVSWTDLPSLRWHCINVILWRISLHGHGETALSVNTGHIWRNLGSECRLKYVSRIDNNQKWEVGCKQIFSALDLRSEVKSFLSFMLREERRRFQHTSPELSAGGWAAYFGHDPQFSRVEHRHAVVMTAQRWEPPVDWSETETMKPDLRSHIGQGEDYRCCSNLTANQKKLTYKYNSNSLA